MNSLFPSDDTLTLNNLCNALSEVKDVTNLGGLGTWLDVPNSKCDQISSQYRTPAQQLQPMLDEWLTSHPDPSWRVVLEGLYRMGRTPGIANGHLYHTILRDVQRQYGRGECVTFYITKIDYEGLLYPITDVEWHQFQIFIALLVLINYAN